MIVSRFLGLLMATALIAGPVAFAQDGSLPAGPKPAIHIDKDPPKLPVPGKTSFTADQARDRMMKRGYNVTSNPLKDENGIWYAEGAKDNGRSVMVMMDYQGNIYEGSDYSGHPSSAPGVETDPPQPIKPVSPNQR